MMLMLYSPVKAGETVGHYKINNEKFSLAGSRLHSVDKLTKVLLFAMLVGGVLAIHSSNETANAITPPDSCFAFSAGTITGYYDNENDDPGQLACPKNVDIPSSIGGSTVTAIGDVAFGGKGLSAISIPDGVTHIGDQAFAGNSGLTSLTLPNSVTTIGSYIIGGSSNITSLTIGTTDYAGEATLVIPDNEGFGGAGLVNVTLGGNVLSVGDYAFSGNNISNLVLSEGLESIGEYAFSFSQITSLVLPDSLTTVKRGAFMYNSNLESLHIGPNLSHISNYVFQGASGLKELYIPSTVTSFESESFWYAGLEKLIIGEADYAGPPVLDIPQWTFQNQNISDLRLYSNVRSIGEFTFKDNDLSGTLSYDDQLPRTLESLGEGAFQGNNFTTAILPDLQTMGDYPLNLNPLNSVTIGTPDYDGEPLLDVPQMTPPSYGPITSLTLGKIVRSVDAGAFSGHRITSLEFAEGIISIGENAFGGNRLTSINIPNSVTNIGANAFSGNFDWSEPHSLTVTIGSGIQTIGDYAFGSNPTLDEVYISGNPVLADSAFENSGGLCGGTELAKCYIRIYATNPDFITTYGPGRLVTGVGWDGNLAMSIGYIINPATYTVSYKSSNGETLAPSFISEVGPTLTDYSFAANQTGDFSLYYRASDVVSLTAPDISPYITPAVYDLTLVAGDNEYTFVYSPIVVTDNNSDPATPNTGLLSFIGNVKYVILTSAVLALLIGSMIVMKKIALKRR